MEVSATPFADQEYSIELIPDDELRSLLNSTKPQDQLLKRKISPEIVRRVLSGKNIALDVDEVTHIARRSNPYDVRGTSILDRVFRLLMYEDKLREAQITIADNFVYPLKIFKLGDPHKGWIPNETHQKALAQMLQQSTFDPNFALIYHYALDVDYVTVADKVMKLDREWDEISKKKMIALGVSQQFITGETSYATANVGLQTQLARYRAKRDLFEVRWIQNKFLKVMAERNEWYRRDRREIVGQYRVARKGKELEDRLIIPKLTWHKKLMMRDDQAFLTFMNNVYAQGKGPVSALTLLQTMGLDLEDELVRKKQQELLEEKTGIYIQPPAVGPMGTVTAKVFGWRSKRAEKKKASEIIANLEKEDLDLSKPPEADGFFTGSGLDVKQVSSEEQDVVHAEIQASTLDYINSIPAMLWSKNLESPLIPSSAVILFHKIGSISEPIAPTKKEDFLEVLNKLYVQGKLFSYEKTGFVPYTDHHELKDYSDLLLCNEFGTWFESVGATSNDTLFTKYKNLAVSAFCFGQIKGFHEQGVYHVKVGNVLKKDGSNFNTKELLSKGASIAFLISPELEIPLMDPCIEGYDGDEFDNQLDEQVERYKTFLVEDTKVIDCPIEVAEECRILFSKLYEIMRKSKFDTITFVPDIVDLPQWDEQQTEAIRQSFAESNKAVKTSNDFETPEFLIESKLQQAKVKHRGFEAIFQEKKALYVSSWLLQENGTFTSQFLKHFKILDQEDVVKTVRKGFAALNFSLTPDEVDLYRALEYIEPVYSSEDVAIGYTLTDSATKAGSIDQKLIKGKFWNLEGDCKYTKKKPVEEIFAENLYRWIKFPHLLDSETKRNFETIRRK